MEKKSVIPMKQVNIPKLLSKQSSHDVVLENNIGKLQNLFSSERLQHERHHENLLFVDELVKEEMIPKDSLGFNNNSLAVQ